MSLISDDAGNTSAQAVFVQRRPNIALLQSTADDVLKALLAKEEQTALEETNRRKERVSAVV